MTRQISIPDDIMVQAEELAAQQHLTVDELIATALSDQIAGAAYIRRRAERASLARFKEALAFVPDVAPDAYDAIPESQQT